MSYSDKFSELKSQVREVGKAIPDTVKSFNEMQKAAKEKSGLPAREVELVALGIAIGERCEPCIMFHVGALQRAGGTREDLAGICAVAMTMGGGPSLMYAAKALAIWDELCAE